jgi:predicted Zn-dependent protease
MAAGPGPICMRALVWVVLTAFLNAAVASAAVSAPISPPAEGPARAADARATASAAAAPPLPPIPLTTDLPSALESQLPGLGSPASAALPFREQYQIGYEMMLQMRAQHRLLQDPEVEEYLNSIGKRLAAQSHLGAATFHYLCVATPVVNSEAALGHFVFINSGLILFTDTESQLAAVMAHETAHEVQNHIARKILNAEHANIDSLAGMFVAILLGAAGGGGGQAIAGGVVASQGLAQQEQIDYSRSVEEEADRVGLELMAAAGFDPEGMPQMFEKLMRLQGLQGASVPAVLIGHPMTAARIAYSQAHAAQYPPVPDTSSADYYIIKARVRVITARASQHVERYYARRIAAGIHSLGTEYGYALALLRNDHAKRAVPIFTRLLEQHPELHLLYSALGQAQAQAGQMQQALATFAQAKRLFPFNVPITVRYAQTLMLAGKYTQAHRMLNNLFNIVTPTLSEMRLTARAASAAGDLGGAYSDMGQYQLALGNLPLAAQQFEIALTMPNLNNVQRARISAQLKQVKHYLAILHARKS